MLHMTRHEDGKFAVSLDNAYMIINGLHIVQSSNWIRPYDLLGVGGARMLLTEEEYLRVLSEFTRYTLQNVADKDVEFKEECVGYTFSVVKNRTDARMPF